MEAAPDRPGALLGRPDDLDVVPLLAAAGHDQRRTGGHAGDAEQGGEQDLDRLGVHGQGQQEAQDEHGEAHGEQEEEDDHPRGEVGEAPQPGEEEEERPDPHECRLDGDEDGEEQGEEADRGRRLAGRAHVGELQLLGQSRPVGRVEAVVADRVDRHVVGRGAEKAGRGGNRGGSGGLGRPVPGRGGGSGAHDRGEPGGAVLLAADRTVRHVVQGVGAWSPPE